MVACVLICLTPLGKEIMTSPDTSSRTPHPDGRKTRYGCRQKRKTAEVSYICEYNDTRPSIFADSQGLRRLRFSFLKLHCQRAAKTQREAASPNP